MDRCGLDRSRWTAAFVSPRSCGRLPRFDRPLWRSTGARAGAIITAFVQPTPRRGFRSVPKQETAPMFAKLKAAWNRLAGPGAGEADAATAPAVEYNGYRIRAAPFRANGLYQTAGIIEKVVPE